MDDKKAQLQFDDVERLRVENAVIPVGERSGIHIVKGNGVVMKNLTFVGATTTPPAPPPAGWFRRSISWMVETTAKKIGTTVAAIVAAAVVAWFKNWI